MAKLRFMCRNLHCNGEKTLIIALEMEFQERLLLICTSHLSHLLDVAYHTPNTFITSSPR